MNLDDILSRGQAAISGADSVKTLDDVRVAYLGKSGEVTGLMKTLGTLAPEQRK